MNRLKAIYIIRGTLVTVTGLHIGKGKDTIEIGGMDSPVIKNTHNGEPYIPGSSLKGKLRSLLEWSRGDIHITQGKQGPTAQACDGGEEPDRHPIARIFGTTHKNYSAGPARLIVRDAFLNAAWKTRVTEAGLLFTEEKMETAIDRIKGAALNGSLRQIERVVPQAEFDFELLYRVFDMNDGGEMDEQNFRDLLPLGLQLLQWDTLGGGGSRGSGKVKLDNLTLRKIEYSLDETGKVIEPSPTTEAFELPELDFAGVGV